MPDALGLCTVAYSKSKIDVQAISQKCMSIHARNFIFAGILSSHHSIGLGQPTSSHTVSRY